MVRPPRKKNKGINKENTGNQGPSAREVQGTGTTHPKAHSTSAGRVGDGKRMCKCRDGGSSSMLSSFCGKQVMPRTKAWTRQTRDDRALGEKGDTPNEPNWLRVESSCCGEQGPAVFLICCTPNAQTSDTNTSTSYQEHRLSAFHVFTFP